MLPVDLAANAESLGADVLRRTTVDEFRAALAEAAVGTGTIVVHVETDPLVTAPDSRGLVGRPRRRGVRARQHPQARKTYDENKRDQRAYLRPARAATP